MLPRFFTSNPDFKPAKKALHVAVKNTRISVSSCQAIELAPSLLIQTPVLGTFEQSQELEMSLDRLYGADGGFRGFIGIEVLRRFDVTLDFSRKRIYLKPNEEIGTPFKLR